MRVAIILCSLVFASAAFVLQPAQAQAGDATLSGLVCTRWTDMDIGECFEPLPGATVAVSGGPAGLAVVEKEAKTDDTGHFEIDGLLPGDYTVSITRTGFGGHSQELSITGDWMLTVALVGQEVDVAGQVVDREGAAVPHAYVSMWGMHSGFESQADAEGRFLARLVAGWYEVRVDSAAGALGGRFVVDGDLELQLGRLDGQDARLSGRITDQHGQPVEDALVVLEQYERARSDGSQSYEFSRNSTQTDADGRYSIGAYVGDASIQVQKTEHASIYDWLPVSAGANTFDAQMVRYPAKTAVISGSVTDAAGQPLPYIHVSLQHPEYGLHECSSSNASHGRGAPEPDMAYSVRPYREPGCAITIHGDGTFTGNVTPGYAILQVGYDRYAACDETRHADGSYERKCGPDYFGHTQTLELGADATTTVEVVLEQRPGPDAAISGYLVDRETQKAIPDAHISFSHQDSGSWGSASTDGDGSYKMRVRSGLHHVMVWADGYLPWEGTVEVKPGEETPLDVPLKQGQSRHGGCCYAYDEVAVADGAGSPAPAGGRSSGQSTESFEDLGGGLGPYDAARRATLLDEPAKKDAPIPLLGAVLAVAVAGILGRRRT